MREAGTAKWAFEEFGSAQIEDRRWARRLVQMADGAARRPAGRVTETYGNGADRQGAYGLLESEAVGCDQISSAMFVAAAKRAVGEQFVYVPVDGSSITLTDRHGRKDFGPIGSRSQGASGLKVMTAMVLSCDGVPLGVSGQKWWRRSKERPSKHRDRRRPAEKETARWLDVMDQTRRVMAEHSPQTRCWFQLDREGDAWPILTQAGSDGHWFTIRSCRKRRVIRGRKRATVKSVLARQPVRFRYDLPVTGTARRTARTAKLELRACSVTLELRDKRTGKRSPMPVHVVQVRERTTTPRGESPIEWTLLTNRKIDSVEKMREVVDGYATRWRIEELHRCWKSGACRVEDTQLRSAAATTKWATILLAVAVRIERIKYLSREEPNRPATDEFTPLEIQAAAALRFGKAGRSRIPPNALPTIAQVTLWVAEIGGYTGRTSSGGPPGAITIARGLKEVRAAARALDALGYPCD